MQKIAVSVLAVAMVSMAAPVSAEPIPTTTYQSVLNMLIEAYGFVPETALVNGVPTPSDAALAMLRENDWALLASEDVQAGRDAGVGIRRSGTGCTVAVVVTAYTIAFGGGFREALVNEEPATLPGGRIACGPGYAYNTGLANAEVGAGATSFACVNTSSGGSWVDASGPCVSGISGASIAGGVGFLKIQYSFFGIYITIEQMFAGGAGALPGAAGQTNAAAITVA